GALYLSEFLTPSNFKHPEDDRNQWVEAVAYILLNIQAAGMSVADPTLASFAVRLDVAATGGSVASKLRRVFLSAVVGAAFGVLSALAQATFYHLGFDPVVPAGHFVGSAEIEIGDLCIANANAIYPSIGVCQVDWLSADIFDSFGNEWTSGPDANIGILVDIFNHQLVSFSSTAVPINTLASGDGCGTISPTLTTSLTTSASFAACELATATYSVTQVPGPAPEPATLTLLSIG